MFDELKVEERPRYDDHTNKISGICQEHSKNTSLEFNLEKEIQLLLDGINSGEVHLAVEVSRNCTIMMLLDNLTHEPIGNCWSSWHLEW